MPHRTSAYKNLLACPTTSSDAVTRASSSTWQFERAETNLVLLLELGVFALVTLAVVLIISTDFAPPLYLFVACMLGVVLALLFPLFGCLVFRPQLPLRALTLGLAASGAAWSALVTTVLVLALILGSTQLAEGRANWILAHYLEPAFALGSPQVVHLAQLIILVAVLPLVACGTLLSLTQLSHAAQAAAIACEARPTPILVFAQYENAHFNAAPVIRAVVIFAGALQEYTSSMLERVCDDVGTCTYNIANLEQVVRNDDVLIQTCILLLLAVVFELLAALSATRVLLEDTPRSKFDNTDNNRIALVSVRAAQIVLLTYCALAQNTQYVPGAYSLHVAAVVVGAALTATETLAQLSPRELRASIDAAIEGGMHTPKQTLLGAKKGL